MTTLLPNHIEWLEGRKLDHELAMRYGVRSRDPRRIAIPYIRDGELAFSKLRVTATKNFACEPTGVPQDFVWNVDALKETPQPGEPLIITEGEFDALACLQAGYRFVVSLPSGGEKKPEAAYAKATRYLCDPDPAGDGDFVRADFAKFDRVVVAADGDSAGLPMRDAIVSILGKRVCYLPDYPEGTKDANDVLKDKGLEALRLMVDSARPAEEDHYVGLADHVRRLPKPVAISIGIPWLAPNIRVTRPGLMVVGGEPGSGKSVVMRAILFNLLLTNRELRASIFNGEGGPHGLYEDAFRFLNHSLPDNQRSTEQKDEWINDKIGLLEPPQGAELTFDWLTRTIELQALRRGRNVFVIDPWNWLRLDPRRGQTMTEAINEAIITLYGLAQRYKLLLIVVQHTTPKREGWRTSEPRMADLADSAHFARKADHVVLCWRPLPEKPWARLIIAKSKRHEINGFPGKHWISFRPGRCELVPYPGGVDPLEQYDAEMKARADERKKAAAETKKSSAVASSVNKGLPATISTIAEDGAQWGGDEIAEQEALR